MDASQSKHVLAHMALQKSMLEGLQNGHWILRDITELDKFHLALRKLFQMAE